MIMYQANPFSFDRVASGDHFCNREKEIEELLGDIKSSHNVIIFSQRRYGKTSLINQVLDLAKDDGILTIYMDIYHIINEEDLVKAYAKALASSIEGSIEKIFQTLKKLFTSLRPRITIDGDGKPEITFGVETGRDPVMDLEEVLESVKKYIDKKSVKATVVFDEFQQIGQLQQAHRVESIIRSRIQRHTDISYIFMGSKKHLIFDMFSNPGRPLYGSGKMFPLEKISPKHLETYVSDRFRSTGKVLHKEIASRLVDICESHPYYTQYISHSLWEITPPDYSATDIDLKNAVNLTISRVSPKYESIWELLPLRQRQALIALSNMGYNEKLFSGKVIQRYGLASAPSFRKALKSLVEKSLVDRDRNAFFIIDVFFKKWIQMTFPVMF